MDNAANVHQMIKKERDIPDKNLYYYNIRMKERRYKYIILDNTIV